jgi:hypothetical protein
MAERVKITMEESIMLTRKVLAILDIGIDEKALETIYVAKSEVVSLGD